MLNLTDFLVGVEGSVPAARSAPGIDEGFGGGDVKKKGTQTGGRSRCVPA